MTDIPLVSISCITFNHAPYLRECFDGFLMQQTDFKFEVVVHDDASTDGTREVIEEYTAKYPDIFVPMYQTENQYSKGVRGMMARFNFPRCRGKYIALCEGDDYWIDPLKLQKQVDFLEANESFSICWTKYKELHQSGFNLVLKQPDWVKTIPSNSDFFIDLNTIFTPYCTYTLTCVFKKEAHELKYNTMQHAKDNTIYALCLSKGNGMLLDFYGGVYRLHEGGIYSGVSSFNQRYNSYLNLKEIVNTISACKNDNIQNIRNGLLENSFSLLAKKDFVKYRVLFYDLFLYLGLKKAILLITKKAKVGLFR